MTNSYAELPPEPGDPPALTRLRGDGDATLYGYAYPMAGVTATLVVHNIATGRFLVVRRAHDPFAGAIAFPGGFMEAMDESVEEAAARELEEETGVRCNPLQLRLIDVRSRPDRDPRNHLVDVGYYLELPNAIAIAGDDAAEVLWLRADQIDEAELAFDHGELWKHAKRIVQE